MKQKNNCKWLNPDGVTCDFDLELDPSAREHASSIMAFRCHHTPTWDECLHYRDKNGEGACGVVIDGRFYLRVDVSSLPDEEKRQLRTQADEKGMSLCFLACAFRRECRKHAGPCTGYKSPCTGLKIGIDAYLKRTKIVLSD